MNVCVQGLGFVGTAMAVAVALAKDKDGKPYFNVVGVDLPTPEGNRRIAEINAGRLPFESKDAKLHAGLKEARARGNLAAGADSDAYAKASIILVDVHCDVVFDGDRPSAGMDGFRAALRTIGRVAQPGTLVIVETTVPPGTCEKVVVPELDACLKDRGLAAGSILVAHSYERVMPGKDYLDSIVNFWRVYSGHTVEAADRCEEFLAKVINTKDFPLTRLKSTTASETAKVLENSYRATTIAFIEEWGRFAEAVGVDLFEVIETIRRRPTHSNIRQPGFGVGGYCLTKDPYLALIGARDFFGLRDMTFPFSTQAVAVNNAMPLVSVDKLRAMFKGSLRGKKILLCGVSYRQDVGDTRYSPSQIFVEKARSEGATVLCHDPLVGHWQELKMDVARELPAPTGLDAIVFAVPHEEYAKTDFARWLSGTKLGVLDANNVLSAAQRTALKEAGCKMVSIGRGEEL